MAHQRRADIIPTGKALSNASFGSEPSPRRFSFQAALARQRQPENALRRIMLKCRPFPYSHHQAIRQPENAHPIMIFRRTALLPCLLAFISSPLFAATENAREAASAPAASNENQTETHAPPLKKSEISPRKDKSKSEQTNEEDEKELTPKYPIIIEADNPEIQAMLEQHLPLIAYQRKEELDREQLGYLAEDAPNDARNMIKTEGYFNSEVSVTPEGEGYRVKVITGKRTTIDNVNVAILGDILQDDTLGSYYKNAFSNWQLPVGAPFRQEDWSSSKTSVLTAVTRKKYPLAQFAGTQAAVNPQTQKADLTVTVDSKKPIYFGEFQIKGNQRYPQSVISGMAQFKTGDVYDLDKLLDYQQALENDSHYSGASVQADFDNLQGDRVPVKVAVSEAKRQKFDAGISFDSEYGLGGELGYEHYNIFNRGYVGSFAWEMDKYQTKLGIGISQPRKGSGYFNTANLAYNRSTTQNLEKRGITSGFWRVRDRDGIESRVGIEFIAEDSRIPNSNVNFGRSYATMLTASWKRQRLETLLRPANGYYLSGKIGATLGSLLSSAPMIRVHGSAGYYYTPENKKLGTWVARGEIGYVHTNQKFEDGNVPSSLMFRSGGASSIRGYELNSIGRKIPPSSAVLPERAMFVASAEYQYPIKGSFALAAFHDVGSVAHRFKDMTLYHGTGIGVRWFSPAAPFSFDIAYGHRDKKLRWHISLGTRF